MEYLRTPEERFEDLPGYPYKPNYVEVGEDGLRMHYAVAGPKDAPPILLLHGEPSWSYLYRHMIPILAEAHYRPIAPDLIGFGKSDKPVERSAYTIDSHLGWLATFIETLNLRNVTLVGQDWGGILGLRLLASHSDRFARAVLANTFLPTGTEELGDAFIAWRDLSQRVDELDCGRVVAGATTSHLSEEVIYAYNAPFPNEDYRAGAREFPMLVPTSPDSPGAADNREAWKVLEELDLPVLLAFSDLDPVTRAGEPILRERLKGARDRPHVTIAGGGHFLQEDRGPELAHAVIDFIDPPTR